VGDRDKDQVERRFALAAPSIALFALAIVIALTDDARLLKAALVALAALAFCNEERVRYKSRRESWHERHK
jgi:hypothetical protein